jgi:hypothetical protein
MTDIESVSAHDTRYIAELCTRLPNMDEMQTAIIKEANVDGDGGDAPFRFTFDLFTHDVVLQWESRLEGWGVHSITRKTS